MDQRIDPTATGTPRMPAEVAGGDVALQAAWILAQTPQPAGAVSADDFALHSATREDAEQLPHIAATSYASGGPGTASIAFSGASLFESALDTSPIVRQAVMICRCRSYEAELQQRAPRLHFALAEARSAAEAEAIERARELNAWAVDADRRAREYGLISDARYMPIDPDRTHELRAQADLDALAAEISAVRQLERAADATLTRELYRLASAAGAYYDGPRQGNVPGRVRLDHIYEARSTIIELCGTAHAEHMWSVLEQRYYDQATDTWRTV